MTAFKDRTGDFTKKKYLYKFYKNGYTSRAPKYMTAGQYMGWSGAFSEADHYVNSGVMNMSGVTENSMVVHFGGAGSSATAYGTYGITTDERRKLDIKDLILSFSHGYYSSFYSTLTEYKINFFDYEIFNNITAGTISVLYKGNVIASNASSVDYSYLRMQEKDGTFYIERSVDGLTWTAWISQAIDFEVDILRSTISLSMSFSMSGPDEVTAYLNNVEAIDRRGQLLAVEARALNDLEFTETINNPASATTIIFPYSPLDVPAHCDIGNFVEIYTHFYDDGAIQYEPILDENSEPILDQNGEEIVGVVIRGAIPEQPNILKFSGYISSIEYDYDNGTIALTFVSHGETASNSIMRDGEELYPIISQLLQNASESSSNRRQTFTLTKMTKVDAISVYLSYTGGGSAQAVIGSGNTTLAAGNALVWSGGLAAGAHTLSLNESIYLEAGTYWFSVNGLVNWHYQSTDVLSGGSRQQLTGGSWQNVAGDAYMVLLSGQRNLNVLLAGDSQVVATDIFAKSLALDYSPLYIEEVAQTDYSLNINLNMDSAKNALNALQRQLPTGWFYHVDIGTGAVRIKDRNATPDHLLVFGRDFTEMKITKDIDSIVNDIYYVGGELVDQGVKLTVRSTDIESIADYRQGTAIITNDKVTRYDTAQLLSNNAINNGNKPRLTTEITLSAAKYNTEAVRIGDVVQIVNGDSDVLKSTLVIADINHAPHQITISLDSAPRNISRTIDAINRQLEQIQTANAGAVV